MTLLTNAPCQTETAFLTLGALTLAGLVLFGVLFALAQLHAVRRNREDA